MTYFDCFLVGAWMFTIGWSIGAIYTQNHKGKTKSSRVFEGPEPCPDCEAWRLPAGPHAVGAD